MMVDSKAMPILSQTVKSQPKKECYEIHMSRNNVKSGHEGCGDTGDTILESK